MQVLLENFSYITWQMMIMWVIGGTLIYLAIAKQMEPTLLLHSIGVNVSGQIASVVAGGLILALVKSAIGG